MGDGSSNPIAAFIFGSIFLAVGLALTYFLGWPQYQAAQASKDWPSVSGVVTNSRVTTSRRSGESTMYSAEVEYDYAVDGEALQGDRIQFAEYKSNSRSQFQKVVRKYPAGKEVKVFYNPDDPAESVLQPGTSWASFLLLGVGLVFGGVGLLVLVSPLVTLAIALALVGFGAGREKAAGFKSNDFTPPSTYDPPADQPRRSSQPPQTKKNSPASEMDDDGFDIK